MSKIGATLAGRDALAAHGIMSLDDTFTWIEADYPHGVCSAMVFVDKSPKPDIKDGKKYSPISKAMVDYMEFPYDDSALLEALELLTPEEKKNLDEYIVANGKQDFCRDERWREFFDDILCEATNEPGNCCIESKSKLLFREMSLKNVVSFMRYLETYYSDGIEKKKLLEMTGDVNAFANISIDDMEIFFLQAKAFHCMDMSEDQINSYISDFYSMLSGLTDTGIPKSFWYHGGYWLPRE